MVLFAGKHKEIKDYIDKHADLFYQPVPQDWKENRILTDKQLDVILQSGLLKMSDFENENIFVLGEYLHYINPSLAIKMGVDIVLFGGALYFLGTDSHRLILDDLLTGKIKGCFAMTEIGHGSNLKQLKTTARKVGDKLIINSNDEMGIKCWIGGSTIADYTTVFCQLEDEKGTNHGIHAVLVPMKNQGIEVNDMGSKLGLNGIDNGYIKFTNVEVPVDNLLNRYGGFKENGEYHSDIKNKEVRFGKMLSALSMGRISIAIGAYAIAYKAFIIALKYNLKRRQFQFRGEKDEKLIIEYQTQLERFAIIYSTLYHLRLGILDLVETYKKEGFSKNVHAISSLLKVYSSWNAVKITALCREMCGGHGYLWKNQIGLLMNDVNIYQTFEGDNTVLIQQGTKWIIDEFRSKNYLNFVKLLNNCGTMKKIENRLYLNIANLIFKLMDKKNIEKRWLSNLRQIVDIGVEYTELYLLSLNPNKSSIIFDAYANYVIDKESSSAMLKLMLERNILSDVVKDWDISYRKLTDYIPITKYPEYFKSSL